MFLQLLDLKNSIENNQYKLSVIFLHRLRWIIRSINIYEIITLDMIKPFLVIFSFVVFFSIAGFLVNKAEIYSLPKKSKRMVKSVKRRKQSKRLKK